MKRKEFLKKSLGAVAATGLGLKGAQAAALTEDTAKAANPAKAQVGFNHLPNKEERTMNTVLHKANTRGHANHGWLNSYHSFSFSNYYNPERVHFGVLRVLNDDTVAPGMGFGTHPHDNMEIVSIPLSGDLEHQDSMGNKAVIKEGDVQAMSAGTGIFHSEYNANKDKEVKFLQIWMFPDKRGVQPRYDQISVDMAKSHNQWQQVLSPNQDDDGVWVHQNAWWNMTTLDAGKSLDYALNAADTNGVYLFVLDGEVTVNGQALNTRDGYGLWNLNQVSVKASSNARLLLMEVPMEVEAA